MTASRSPRIHFALATALCAIAFFLGTADVVFAFRVHGVNVRLANLVLGAGFAYWLATRRGSAMRDLAALAPGWLPFVTVYAVAAMLSQELALGLLKLGWFAFNFAGAYAWCRLFDRGAVARGYFTAFLVVSLVIAADFVSGFTRGPEHMVGLGQPNDHTAGQILWRPHAFYYEPSYAASGVALAWALALTRFGAAAAPVTTVFLATGAVALIVMLSRTGWLYALLAAFAVGVLRAVGHRSAAPIAWRKAFVAFAGVLLACAIVLLPAQNRVRFAMLADALGWEQTFERICPLIRDGLPWLGLRCLEGDERLRYLSRSRDLVPEQASEGQRISNAKRAIARIQTSPWLGTGVARGERRLLNPSASNTWLEIAVEGGVLSALAFAWGLGYSLWRFGAFARENRAIGVVLVLYFAVAWQVLQTFPRLDQWLSFWAALTFAFDRRCADVEAAPAATRPTGTAPTG